MKLDAFWRGSFLAIIITATSWLGAGNAHAAEGKPDYSAASVTGTFVFRTSGNSLFTSPQDVTSAPVFLASTGLTHFDGKGRLRGKVATSATRTVLTPSGKFAGPYTSQLICEMSMTGTYSVNADGSGVMTINFSPTSGTSACGASTGNFNVVRVSSDLIELVSIGPSAFRSAEG